ncbi:MAG: hypothetical protein IIZ68_07115, partial [Clostridia bacterium]|nr:hypothetical protein [Clostridia bacterium]
TLILEEMTSFRLYFESDDTSALTIKNGENTLTIHSGTGAYQGMYYVEITNIYAQHLDDMYDFSISNGTESTTAHHGPLGYAKWALSTNKENLKYAMMALFHYNRSAETYFIANP